MDAAVGLFILFGLPLIVVGGGALLVELYNRRTGAYEYRRPRNYNRPF